jgi:hypothetical protein
LDILMRKSNPDQSTSKKQCTGANTTGNEQGTHGQAISWNMAQKPLYECGGLHVQCGECETRCPYQLPIRERIVENVAFYERVAAED